MAAPDPGDVAGGSATLGPHLTLVPGDLGDARFNNYILEHFFQWVRGAVGDYWTALFLLPLPADHSISVTTCWDQRHSMPCSG